MQGELLARLGTSVTHTYKVYMHARAHAVRPYR